MYCQTEFTMAVITLNVGHTMTQQRIVERIGESEVANDVLSASLHVRFVKIFFEPKNEMQAMAIARKACKALGGRTYMVPST